MNRRMLRHYPAANLLFIEIGITTLLFVPAAFHGVGNLLSVTMLSKLLLLGVGLTGLPHLLSVEVRQGSDVYGWGSALSRAL